MEKFDIRLFFVLLFFGTSSAESATSEKVRYGSKSDYSLLKEDLKGCREFKTDNLSVRLFFKSFENFTVFWAVMILRLSMKYMLVLLKVTVSFWCHKLRQYERKVQFARKTC